MTLLGIICSRALVILAASNTSHPSLANLNAITGALPPIVEYEDGIDRASATSLSNKELLGMNRLRNEEKKKINKKLHEKIRIIVSHSAAAP